MTKNEERRDPDPHYTDGNLPDPDLGGEKSPKMCQESAEKLRKKQKNLYLNLRLFHQPHKYRLTKTILCMIFFTFRHLLPP